jgi:hypothetical protein
VQAAAEGAKAAAECAKAAAECAQAQGASVLAATHAVGTSVQAVGQRVEAVGQRVEAVGQRVEDNIMVTTQINSLTAANTASLQALAKATQESKRQELLASLSNLESACQEEAVQEARHAQLLAQFHHVGAMVSHHGSLLHRAAGTPATGTPAAGAPLSLAPFPLETSRASAKQPAEVASLPVLRATPTPAQCTAPPSAPRASRESTASAAAPEAKRPKTKHAFGSSYQIRGESSAMLERFPAKRLPSLSLPTGQPLSPSGKGNRGL